MLTDHFDDYNILYKVLYLTVAILGVKFRYYSAWSLGMVGMNAIGITYNPEINENGEVTE